MTVTDQAWCQHRVHCTTSPTRSPSCDTLPLHPASCRLMPPALAPPNSTIAVLLTCPLATHTSTLQLLRPSTGVTMPSSPRVAALRLPMPPATTADHQRATDDDQKPQMPTDAGHDAALNAAAPRHALGLGHAPTRAQGRRRLRKGGSASGTSISTWLTISYSSARCRRLKRQRSWGNSLQLTLTSLLAAPLWCSRKWLAPPRLAASVACSRRLNWCSGTPWWGA